ncbi:hypothetical protein [Prosthecobacter sp.]|uniref:hypothetical protein n=1 Tax=Prosthecobacter sp. TaxID=1965333 RepID=UPI002487D192|nr:hypothetical protein [Prosthecobacter sp.]MDI1313891.1 hypothetical protein [Prosthecobacter sp.]
MKRFLQAFLLIVTATSFSACLGPNMPPPRDGPRGRGRSLDVPPRYGVPQEQTQYFDGVDLSNPNAAAVQQPDPNAPVTGDNVTAPPATESTTAPPPVSITPPGSMTPPAAPTPADIPYATRISGKPGFVKSPFDPNGQAIDVRDFQSGQKARCPYTGKIFRVP